MVILEKLSPDTMGLEQVFGVIVVPKSELKSKPTNMVLSEKSSIALLAHFASI